MAGHDPRRSSRARTTQPQSQISSTTSSTSGRADRNPRFFNKGGSPHKSASTGSLSSEPPEDTIMAEDTLGTRRRTRGQVEERERTGTKMERVEMSNGDDDLQEEDEAVRCICGFDDYPGPPPFDEDTKHGLKDSVDIDPIFATDVTDDAAGFFVQCDVCKVWQHGACVGIMTEESSPEEYFCEQCRKDLHRIFTASNGQRFSHYLPLKRYSRHSSTAVSLNKDGTRSPPKEREGRNGRGSSASQNSKRRSTMNSREAGYDEAEALRRAIEASKEDAAPELPEGGSRRPKRGRSDSEEKLEGAKRRRTSSRSASPSLDKAADDSDEGGALTRNGASKSKSRSSAAFRHQRVEKPSEREELERLRAEAANKRKGRAERRRAEDSDPSEELPLAARAAVSKTTATAGVPRTTTTSATGDAAHPPSAVEPIPISQQPSPDTDTTGAVPGTTSTTSTTRNDKKRSHKKKGRNQYTRDREGNDEDSPVRSQSRDLQKEDHPPPPAATKASGEGSNTTHSRSHAKGKGGMSSKITMTELKRRAGNILDFISRTQLELAGEIDAATGETSISNSKTSGGSSSSATTEKNSANDAGDAIVAPAALAAPPEENKNAPAISRFEGEFKDLNCMEMMDSLTRRLVKWQQEYAT
ncbi:hypothetical protein B0T26DRAFT_658038 [Lasiosphaeria miniovina]|uniref:Zinc finger PHD-type domain-containing protein n=1 Tax=Lasiosphaeria miniovina TaxID=1954250 RepID=A0AA40DHP7_9PEZI|nr:uncharacterized protein B0T26DRAFT_658038 [Lasiosphaeria miniovina]KAK0703550.1 hypothetical protein B0T26DRAFT_658038 [Lasiosphaeria miniovina]